MHAQPTYEDQLEPVIIHKEIFNGLRKFACSKVPKRRYVSLLFDIHPAQEINPDIKPDADNPTRVVIFAVSAINDQAFQPLGYVFLHETTPAKELSDCIKRYIADLLLCELVVINTICPPSNYLKTAVENLVTVGEMKNKTEAHVINVWDCQIFHLYDAPSMLAEIRKEFKKAPASFRQYNTNFTAYYEDVEKVVRPVSKDDILSAVKLFSMTSYHKIIDEMRVSGHSLKEGSAEICAFFDILFDTFYGDNSSNNRNRMPLTSSSVHESNWKNSLSVLKSMSFIRSSKSEVEEIEQQIKNDNAVDTVRDVINTVAHGTLCGTTPPPHEACPSQEVDNKPTKKKHKKKHAKHSENKTLHDNNSEINNSLNTNHCNFSDPTDMLDSQNNISYLENVLEGTGCDVNVVELNKSLNVPDTEELKHRKQKEKIMYATKKMIDIIHSVGVQNANEHQVENFSVIKTKTLDDCDTKKLDERIEKSDWMENIMKKYKPHDENNQTSVKKTEQSIANKNFKVQDAKNKETSRKNLSNKTSTTSITSKNNVHFSKKGKRMPKHNESTNAANEHVTCTNNYIETMNQSNESHNSRQTYVTPLENQDTPPRENSPKNVLTQSNNRNIQQMENSMQNVSKIDGQGDQQMKNESQNIVTPVRSKNIGHSEKPFPKIVHRKEYRNSNWKKNSPKRVVVQQIESFSPNAIAPIRTRDIQQMENSSHNAITKIKSKNLQKNENSHQKLLTPENLNTQQIENTTLNPSLNVQCVTPIDSQGIQQVEDCSQNIILIENRNVEQKGRTENNVAVIKGQNIQEMEDSSQKIQSQDIQQIANVSQNVMPTENRDINEMKITPQNVGPIGNTDGRQLKNSLENVVTSMEIQESGVTNIKIKNNQNVPRGRNEKYRNGQQKTPKRVVVQQIESSSQNAIAPIRTRDIQQMENSSHNAITKIKSKNLQKNENSHQKLLTPENLYTQQIENTTLNPSLDVQCVTPIDSQGIQQVEDCSQNIIPENRKVEPKGKTENNIAVIKGQNIQEMEDSSQKIQSQDIQEIANVSQNVMPTENRDINEMKITPQNVEPIGNNDSRQLKHSLENVVTSMETQENGAKSMKIKNNQNVSHRRNEKYRNRQQKPMNIRNIENTEKENSVLNVNVNENDANSDSRQLKNSLENVATPMEIQESGVTNMKIKNNQNVPCSRNEKYRNKQQKSTNITNIENTGKENSVLNEKVNENDANSRKVKVSPDHKNISTDEKELERTEFQNLIANGNSHNNNKLISPLNNVSNSQVKTILHNTESYKNDKNKSTSNSETESKNKTPPITSKPNAKEIGKSQTSQNLRIERENETVSFSNKESLLPIAYINIKIETKKEKALEPKNRQEKVFANGKKSVPKKPSNPDDSIDIFNRNIRKYYQGIETKPKPCVNDVHIVGKESHKEFETAIPKETENKSKIQMVKTVTNIVMNGINESESNFTNSIKTNDEISLAENKNSVICTKTKTTAEVEENLMISTSLNVETENVKKENIISNKTNDEANLIVSNETIEEYSIILDTLEELENMQTEFSNMKQHYQYTMEICNKVMDSLSPDGLLQAISKEDLINIITTIPAGKDVDTVFSEIVQVSARPLELLADSSEKFLLDLDMIYLKLLEIQNFEATLRNNEDGAVNCDTKTSYDNATKEQDTPMEIDPISEDEGDIHVLKDSYRPYVLDAWMISINGMREIYKSMNAKRFESINTRQFNLDPLRYLTNELKNANQIPTVHTLTSELQLMDESLLAVFYSSKAGITLE